MFVWLNFSNTVVRTLTLNINLNLQKFTYEYCQKDEIFRNQVLRIKTQKNFGLFLANKSIVLYVFFRIFPKIALAEKHSLNVRRNKVKKKIVETYKEVNIWGEKNFGASMKKRSVFVQIYQFLMATQKHLVVFVVYAIPIFFFLIFLLFLLGRKPLWLFLCSIWFARQKLSLFHFCCLGL